MSNTTTNSGSSLGSVIVAFFVLMLAASAIGGGSGYRGRPYYLTGDPCPEGTPGWRLAAPEWDLTHDDGEKVRLHLTCEEFRYIANHNYMFRPTSKQIIDCITNVLANGVVRTGGGVYIYTLHFTSGGALSGLAQVTASASSGGIFSASVNSAPWSECAG